ncbi:hypothetical protein ACJMK2_020109, partial [Sinanodonta woodiana]
PNIDLISLDLWNSDRLTPATTIHTINIQVKSPGLESTGDNEHKNIQVEPSGIGSTGDNTDKNMQVKPPGL